MKIVVGSDHAGFRQKETIKKHLIEQGYGVIDVGTYSIDSCDYPIFGAAAGKEIAEHRADFGILVCSSGEGIMISANKIKGVRCGLGYNDEVSRLMREHNDANMIAFGASFIDDMDAIRRVDIFLNAQFLGDRHSRRVNEIVEIENN